MARGAPKATPGLQKHDACTSGRIARLNGVEVEVVQQFSRRRSRRRRFAARRNGLVALRRGSQRPETSRERCLVRCGASGAERKARSMGQACGGLSIFWKVRPMCGAYFADKPKSLMS
eukprot:scaffold2952_cov312-Pinguiococcus_pyrenoidosus.AAC.25